MSAVPTMTGALQSEVPLPATVAVAGEDRAVGEGWHARECPVARAVGADGAEVDAVRVDIHRGVGKRCARDARGERRDGSGDDRGRRHGAGVGGDHDLVGECADAFACGLYGGADDLSS
jgi:hypothetical protein